MVDRSMSMAAKASAPGVAKAGYWNTGPYVTWQLRSSVNVGNGIFKQTGDDLSSGAPPPILTHHWGIRGCWDGMKWTPGPRCPGGRSRQAPACVTWQVGSEQALSVD
jgi:hypothetical protein